MLHFILSQTNMNLLFFSSLLFHFVAPSNDEGLVSSNYRISETRPIAEMVLIDSVFVSPSIFMFELEGYTDDIPFNTLNVVRSLGTSLPEEAYVDDIPFNTEALVQCKRPYRTKSKNAIN